MKNFVFKNHQLIAEKQAQVSINERAFLFGDGIFETCKIFAGKIYDFESHKSRARKGLKALRFSADISDLEKKSYQLIKKNKIENGTLRFSISRGVGSYGYLPTYESKPLIIIQTFAERKITAKKVVLGISSIKKPPQNSLPIACKTMQTLPYILNKIAAQEQKVFDLIMFSQKNFVSETSAANIFWVKNGKIYTPSKACDVLLGTVRKKLLKISPLKIYEVEASINALRNADEIFLTNSSFLVLAVDELLIKNQHKKLQKNFAQKFLKLMQEDVINSCKK